MARRELKDAETRFDTAHQAWDRTGELHARWLQSQRDMLAPRLAELEAAQAARHSFLTEHPEVPGRLADLNRAIKREQELERLRSWELVKQRELARHLGRSHDVDRGYEVELDRGYGMEM